MLANIACWIIALGLMFSRHNGEDDLYLKLLFAMGFIFLGILSKAVDYYREVHREKKATTGNDTVA